MRTKANRVAGGIIASLTLLVLLILWVDARQDGAEEGDWLDAVRPGAAHRIPGEQGGSPHMLPGLDGDPATAPVIAVRETEVDAGVISREAPSDVEITIFNEGRRTLVISDVITDDGSTVRAIEDTAIPGGGETVMTVSVNPAFMQGFETEYEVTLVSNDPRRSRLPLRIRAEVEPEFAIEPPYFDFGEVALGETVERTLRVRQVSEVPVSVTGVEPLAPAPGLSLHHEQAPESEWEDPDRPEYLITAVYSPSGEVGSRQTVLSLNTSLERLPRLGLAVTAEVVSFYEIEPRRIRITEPVQPGQEAIAAATVSADRPIAIEDLVVTGEDFTVDLRPGDDPNTSRIVLNVSPEAATGRRTAQIEFSVVSEQEAVADSIQLIVQVAE